MAAPAASCDILRLRTLLRIDLCRDVVSLGGRAGTVCLYEPSRTSRHRRRRCPRRSRAAEIAPCSGAAATLRYRTQPTAISNYSFIVLLLLAPAVTGLLLLVLRHERAMGLPLVVHLGIVLALFLTLPYGNLLHGIYRGIALLRYRREH